MTLYQITAPHFCAGVVVGKYDCIMKAAPILKWAIGTHIDSFLSYCSKKNWKVHKCASRTRPN